MQPSKSRGFSLIEIAVVLIIISVLITMVAVPLATQLDLKRREETAKQLELIKEAVIGFALSNGRFPCAARSTDNGLESVIDANAGTCNSFNGFLPAATLGLNVIDSSGFAVDAWGIQQNRIRYAVADAGLATANAPCPNTGVHFFTQKNGMQKATMSCLNDNSSGIAMLTVKSTSVTNPPNCIPATLTTKSPFVVFSLGKNAATGGVDPDEAINLTANAVNFISHTPTAAGTCAGEFDDIVTWPSLNTIFGRMVQAGKLP